MGVESMTHRLLTPAEAAFLLVPKASSASKCLQAALLSLLSTGRIAIDQPSSVFKEATLIVTRDAPPTAQTLPAHLKVVEEALTSFSADDRMVSARVLQALQKRFGSDFRRYIHDDVAPALVQRELLIRTDGRWLGLFPKISYERTKRGETIIAPLERLLSAVNQVPSLIERDPDAAIKIAMEAGALLVMSPPARRKLPALKKLLAERADGDVPLFTTTGIGNNDGGEAERFLDIADIEVSLDTATLFDSIDAVGDFTSGGDSSSSDGGDGGGGGD
jgi:hypothetical protein